MPGETVEYGGDEILVDGEPLSPPAHLKGIRYVGLGALKSALTPSDSKIVLTKDEYFVLGDNTTNAHDSRFWGAVPRESITGRLDVP